MRRHNTQVLQMVNKLPHYIGYSDSCEIGTGGGLVICPKQDRPYHLAIRVATKVKWTIQGRHPYHKLSRSGRAGYQMDGAIMPHIQLIKYPRRPLLWQHFGGGVENQAKIRFLPSSRTSTPLPRHTHTCSTSFTPPTHHHIWVRKLHVRRCLPWLSKRGILC